MATAESSYDLVKNYLAILYNQANSLRFDLNSILEQIANTRPEDPPDLNAELELPNIDYQSLDNVADILTQRIEETVPKMEEISDRMNSFVAVINDMINQANYDDINLFFDDLINGFPEEPNLNIPSPPNQPNINLPNEPSFVEEQLPNAPTIDIPNAPSEPSNMTMPNKPNLLNINIPPMPVINLPEAPTLTDIPLPNAPDLNSINLDRYNEDPYNEKFPNLPENIRTLMAGGDTSDLTKLERSMIERIYQELEDFYNQEIDNLNNKAEKLGYMLPSGIYLKEVRRARSEMLKRKSEALSKLQSALSEFHNKNRQLGIGAATDVEKLYMTFYDSKQERRLKYYLAQIDIALKDFDARLRAVMSHYEALKNKIALFQGMLDAEKTKLAIYQSQIDGQKVIADLNKSLVDEYKAELQALETQVNVYESQVKAYATKVQAELNKIEMYKSQLSAYTIKMDTNRLKTEIYKSRIEAERSKADIYESQMKGYVSIIQAESLKLENYKNLLQAQVAKISAKLDIYKTNFDFRTKALSLKRDILALMADTAKVISAIEEEIAKIYLNVAQAKVSVWNSKLEGELKYFEALVRKYTAMVDISLKNSEIDLEHLKTIASIMSTLAAAYVNAMNVAASASDSESTIVQT